MHPNITILRKALADLGISFSEIAGFGDAVMVKDRAFIRAATAFNAESVSALCRDKDAVHKLLAGKVPMPKTKGFLDRRADIHNLEKILIESSDILYPRIIKMNQGENGRNVFLVQNDAESLAALKTIFDKSKKHYDFIALVQEYVEPAREFRIAVSGGAPVLAYDRNTAEILSDSRAIELSHTVLQNIRLSWGAIDFIESKSGELFFLEINSKPSFDAFVAVHGDEPIKDLYKTAFKNLTLS